MSRLRGWFVHQRFLIMVWWLRRRAKQGHRMHDVEQAILHFEAANRTPGMSDEWRVQARAKAVREISVFLGYEPGSAEAAALIQKLRDAEAEASLEEASDE